MTEHIFKGRWISDRVLANVAPRNVFHRQLTDKSCRVDWQLRLKRLFQGW